MSAIPVPSQATWKLFRLARSSLDIPEVRNICFLCRRKITDTQKKQHEPHWSFVTGRRLVFHCRVVSTGLNYRPKGFRSPSAFGFAGPQIAFTLGTIAVIPFYTLMILSPNAPITKKTMENNTHYVVLGVLYAYLLYLSWTPEKLQLLFPNKYFIPEIEGVAKMFSNEMTLASAWIHLLVVDLFAARQIYLDGLENKVETRHSVLLCLFSCPLGLITHVITKLLFKTVLSQKSDEDS